MRRCPDVLRRWFAANAVLEQRAFVELQRAADRLMQQVAELLKPHGISATQYNVLRILRGAQPEPLSCGEIAERMFTHAPDITRLLDRMEAPGLIARCRESEDRRVVRASITEKGLDLLVLLDPLVRQMHRRQFAALGRNRLAALVAALDDLTT